MDEEERKIDTKGPKWKRPKAAVKSFEAKTSMNVYALRCAKA